jgi:hypothetical protein
MRVVLFGNFEFGEFVKSDDRFPCALIHEIQDQQVMTELDAEEHMHKHNYSGYLIPSIFDGEIYYTEGEKPCRK